MKQLDSASIQARQMKWYWPLVVIYVVFQLVSDVTAGKIVQLGPAVVSVTVLYFPITYLISDILTEVYGYERARRALWSVLAASIVAGVIYQIVVVLPPSPSFPNNAAYATVLGTVPRILIAGWIAIFVGDIVNNFVMSRLKLLTKGRRLWLRTISSTILGQGFNTSIFYIGALWGVLPTDILLAAIVWGWAIKVLVEVAMTPITYFAIRRLKLAEGFDAFDYSANYNPFKLKSTALSPPE
jgi:queuosine precursor transporter